MVKLYWCLVLSSYLLPDEQESQSLGTKAWILRILEEAHLAIDALRVTSSLGHRLEYGEVFEWCRDSEPYTCLVSCFDDVLVEKCGVRARLDVIPGRVLGHDAYIFVHYIPKAAGKLHISVLIVTIEQPGGLDSGAKQRIVTAPAFIHHFELHPRFTGLCLVYAPIRQTPPCYVSEKSRQCA